VRDADRGAAHDLHHDDDGSERMTVATLLHVLAAEGPTKANIWNPTIIGILTVLCAIGLFCGSVYMLLSTNLGARLGFLVAAAGFTGFLVLLTTLWWTAGSSGIDPPHGRSPGWNVVEVVSQPTQSKFQAVRNIAQTGKPVDASGLTNLKPAVDAAIVPAASVNGETPKARPFATLQYTSTSDYIADFPGFKSYEVGGGTQNLIWHSHQYAAVQVCSAKKDLKGNAIAPAVCDPLQPTHYVILSHDLGTLRQPVVLYWFMVLILFGLSLLGLHWYEQDERARRRATLAPVPARES
jgi:hypothetical protein